MQDVRHMESDATIKMKHNSDLPLHYFAATAQGRRSYMEDTYCIAEIHPKTMLFAVFDGHGGSCVSTYCARNVARICKETLTFSKCTISHIDAVFLNLDEEACLECPTHCGATALMLFADKHTLRFANCGDTMAMVIDVDNNVTMVSEEHKVENEKERIVALGGRITYDDGIARIFRTLNISRAIGDVALKEYVVSDPYVHTVKTSKVKWIVLASDGLWDVYNPEEVAQDIRQYVQKHGNSTEALSELPSWLINKAIHSKGSTDNITVIVIKPDLQHS